MLNSDIEGRAAAGGTAILDSTGIGNSVKSSSSCIPVTNPALAGLVVAGRLVFIYVCFGLGLMFYVCFVGLFLFSII